MFGSDSAARARARGGPVLLVWPYTLGTTATCYRGPVKRTGRHRKGGLSMPEHSVAKARERRDYERTASIISGALTVVGSSDLAMRGLTTAVKRTAKSAQQEMIADWLKEYTAPGHPGNTFFKNIRHLHPNVRKRFVAGMMANFFMRDPEYTESLLEEKRHLLAHGHPHQPLDALQPQMRRLLRGRVRRRGRAHRSRSREHHQPGRSHRLPRVRDAGRRALRVEAAPRHHRAPSRSRSSWCSPTPP